MKLRNKKSYAFTLIEVMVALVLIAIASTAIGIRTRSALEEKKFTSDIERLKNRMFVVQKLAIASQADWTGLLQKGEKGWIFEVRCDEAGTTRFPPLQLKSMDIAINGKKLTGPTHFDFFASGHTSPQGVFSFQYKDHKCQWDGADLFQRREGGKNDRSKHLRN